MKREALRTGVFTRRALLLAAGQMGALGLLATKLYQVQVVEGTRYATLAETNRVSTRLIAPRGGGCSTGSARRWRATARTGGPC